MSEIELAVIGCGRMGKMHIENIQSYFSNIKIRSVVDPNPDKDWLVAHGIEQVYTDCTEVLNDKKIHAVIIAASSREHVNLIQAAAQANKQIFCEKPIALDIVGIQTAITAVRRFGVKMQVGFNRRFDPTIAKLKDNVQKGVAGKLYSVRITNRDPRRPDLAFIPQSGGQFLDFHVHDFDTLRFVSGREIDSIQAFGANLVDLEIGKLGDIDTSVISCLLKGGGVASIDASREAVYGYDQRVEVLGSQGSLEAENQIADTLCYSERDKIYTAPLKATFVERYQKAYRNQMQAFFEYLSTENADSPVDGYDALIAVACAIAAGQSMQNKRAVSLHEIL